MSWSHYMLVFPVLRFHAVEDMLSLRFCKNRRLTRILKIKSCGFTAFDDTIQWYANIIPRLAKIFLLVSSWEWNEMYAWRNVCTVLQQRKSDLWYSGLKMTRLDRKDAAIVASRALLSWKTNRPSYSINSVKVIELNKNHILIYVYTIPRFSEQDVRCTLRPE